MALRVTHNADQVAALIRQRGDAVRAAVVGELDAAADMAARTMRKKAPKWRTTLTDSIHVEKTGEFERVVATGVGYAKSVELGVRPGGKGLPRFFDPASAEMVAWLRDHAFKGRRTAKVGTRARQAMEIELRDRYEGLAWHVRHHGVKAQPFARSTMDEVRPLARERFRAAVARALSGTGGAPAGGAA